MSRARQTLRGTRRVLATLGPTVLGSLLLLAGIEGALRAVGWEAIVPLHGDPAINLNPFLRNGVRPDGTPVVRARGSLAEFLATKPPNGFRVFVLGESSVEGRPYPPSFAFPALLEQRLAAALPDRHVEVVNCGLAGLASWHIKSIAREVVAYQPDVVLVYAGHNDFISREPRPVGGVMRALARTRTFQLAVRAGQDLKRLRQGPFDEREATSRNQPFLFRERATGASTLSAADHARIVRRFAENLRDIVDVTRAVGGIPIVTTVAQNLRDWPPGAWRHRPALAPERTARWAQRMAEGDRLRAAGDCHGALAAYAGAARIDARVATLHYVSGRCLERVGEWARARFAYRRASDLDAVPMGATSALNRAIRRAATAAATPLVDVARRLERTVPHGLPGDELFVDYVHPTLLGHQRIAAIVADELRDLAIPVPANGWAQNGYRDPDPAELTRSDPELVRAENLMRYVCLAFVYGGEGVARGRAVMDQLRQ